MSHAVVAEGRESPAELNRNWESIEDELGSLDGPDERNEEAA